MRLLLHRHNSPSFDYKHAEYIAALFTIESIDVLGSDGLMEVCSVDVSDDQQQQQQLSCEQ